jgi:nitrate reductase NapAB chaperone NapD
VEDEEDLLEGITEIQKIPNFENIQMLTVYSLGNEEGKDEEEKSQHQNDQSVN